MKRFGDEFGQEVFQCLTEEGCFRLRNSDDIDRHSSQSDLLVLCRHVQMCTTWHTACQGLFQWKKVQPPVSCPEAAGDTAVNLFSAEKILTEFPFRVKVFAIGIFL